jgi:uracil-DNA glycosylase
MSIQTFFLNKGAKRGIEALPSENDGKKAKVEPEGPTGAAWEPYCTVKGTWAELLEKEVERPYFKQLNAFVDGECAHKKIYPPRELIFNALASCDFENVKVVIIGQDPYHAEAQAHGLAFSVQKGVAVPPSLRNIYKELSDDLGFSKPSHGNLQKWNDQGVLLLNTCLTVRKAEAFSHKGKGWETFVDAVIKLVSKNNPGVVFMLWGKPAQLKATMVDKAKHRIITSSHPSPLAYTKTAEPFSGSRCFSRCNALLEKMGRDSIDWQIL